MRSPTILIVDDEQLVRWSLSERLTQEGYDIVEAGTAKEALARCGPDIDLVLLDYRLPDSTDLRLLEEVRRRVPKSAVVIMTAFGSPEMVQGALDRGAYCVLTKPFDMHAIASVVAEASRAARYR